MPSASPSVPSSVSSSAISPPAPSRPSFASRLARGAVCACAAFSAAHAQTPVIQARIDAPDAASLVRIRWPATSLSRAEAARLVALDDAAGTPLAFGFLIAPEDQGRAVRPMWLITRLHGSPPYLLSVRPGDARGVYRDDPDDLGALAGQRLPPLADLPVATVSAQAWGPIVAMLADAQATQRAADARWRRPVWALALAALAALAALIAFFARSQARRDDVSRL